jgi:hypothetical protein
MPAQDQAADGTADLERLATALAALGLKATLTTPGHSMPCLAVRNPRAHALAETVYACDGSYWWSWREPITTCDQTPTAAKILARVLRAVGEQP